MDRCILTLVLLILIASGTLYILTHNKKKKTLESYANQCLKGCQAATAITGNCRFLPQPNGKNIYSCPQECHSLNLSGRQDTCTYDDDCKNCNKTTLYPNGRPTNPNTPPTKPPVGPPVGPPTRPPVGPPTRPPVGPPTSPPVGPPVGPPGSVPGGKMAPSLPTSPFSPTKMNKQSSLCPASTIVIFNS